jgi:hypothetical protein
MAQQPKSFPEETIEMNTKPLTNIAPDILRKRLLIEGFFTIEVSEDKLKEYFSHITHELGLRTYGEPIIHQTSGKGREINQGYDAFVPLIDSGIYIGVWVNPKFLSTILYTCADFDDQKAVQLVKEFFQLSEFQSAIF